MEVLAATLLTQSGFASTGITKAPGFANSVWQTPQAVIRINEGRFPDAFRHEADILVRLRSSMPVPNVLAIGKRDPDGEFIILERLPGVNLQDAWPMLTSTPRRALCEDIGSMIRTLHATPLAEWASNPWVDHAMASKNAGNAYHAPVKEFGWLAESAVQTRPDLEPLINQVKQFITANLPLFDEEEPVFVHADLHFRNIMVHEGQISGLIDFEGAQPAPRSTELDMLVRWLIGQSENDAASYVDLIPGLRSTYSELFGDRHLVSKLEVYELLWHLVQLHHWQPGARWMNDPGEHIDAVLRGTFGEKVEVTLS